MQGQYIKRYLENQVNCLLDEFPAVALIGPRQSGKSTLAQNLMGNNPDSIALDLELPSEQRRLSDPELYFDLHRDKLICLDEVQRMPQIFQIMRSKIDRDKRNGQFLILGSASRDLMQQSSETLAGRLAYVELTPFQMNELIDYPSSYDNVLNQLWLRGGFPRSFLAKSDAASNRWRDQFTRAFLERDIPQLGFNIPAMTIQRLWQMCAHSHGQILNASKIGASLGFSHTSIRNYIELLVHTFMVRLLQPVAINTKKRLVKSPKIYIRDSGILHHLLNIENYDHLLGHPVFGSSWEGFAIESILALKSDWKSGFYRTAAGAELDLVLEYGREKIGFEFKASVNPQLTRGFWNAIEDLNLDHVWVVALVNESYPLNKKVTVVSLSEIIKSL